MSDNDKKPNFRVHFRYEVPGLNLMQKNTYEVHAANPESADAAVRRAYPGRRVFIDKIKAIKEDA